LRWKKQGKLPKKTAKKLFDHGKPNNRENSNEAENWVMRKRMTVKISRSS